MAITNSIFGRNKFYVRIAGVKNFYKEFGKYLLAGGLAFVLDVSTLYVLTEFFDVHYLVSGVFAFIIGLITAYILSVKWVFSNRSLKSKKLEFIVFTIIGIVGLGLNEFLLWFFTEKLFFHYLFSKIVSTAVIYFWNFFARKYTLFR